MAGACFTNVKWTAEWIDGNYDATDYYEIVVTGYDGNLDAVGSVTIDMTDNVDWEWQSLGFKDVYALGITMQSSDDWTPTYFCIDNISEVPEPGMLAMLICAGMTLMAIRRRG